MKKFEMPCFDDLVKMAAEDPDRLDALKKAATDQLIADAPEKYQRRLRGLQFQIDMEVRRSKSAMDGCIRVSNMMHESLWQLREQLNVITGKYGKNAKSDVYLAEQTAPAMSAAAGSAKILPFRI